MPDDCSSRAAALHELLDAYLPADEVEHRHCARLRELLDRGDAVFARDHFRPGHITASAFVLSPERDALLLVHHRKLGLWLQPGGHVDGDDADILAAARREVGEEVGLTSVELALEGLFDVDVHAIPARAAEPAHEHFDVRVLLAAPHRAFVASDEVLSARWVTARELAAIGTDASVRRAATKVWPAAA